MILHSVVRSGFVQDASIRLVGPHPAARSLAMVLPLRLSVVLLVALAAAVAVTAAPTDVVVSPLTHPAAAEKT